MEAFNISKDLGISSDQLGPELMRLENLIITNAADQESGNSLDAAIKLKMAYDLNLRLIKIIFILLPEMLLIQLIIHLHLNTTYYLEI